MKIRNILITIAIVLGLANVANAQSSSLWKFTSSLLQPVVSTWNLYSPADFRFDGDLLPDGADCSAGEILKKTGANNWDCAADDTVGGGAVDGTGTAGMLTSWVDVDTITATGTPTAARYIATSTVASVFPYASTTALSATTLYGALVGNASTASALFANGSNCSAGSAPLGVDASGAVESCFDVWTESENTSAAYTPQSTTITVAGTASQITSSAGAQSLAANRTWTLSLPNHVIFPSSLQVASATTTNATTTNLHITGLNCTGNSNGGALTVDANGRVACSDDDSTAGSGTSAVATSTADTANQVTFFTSTNATPATIGGDSGFTYNSTTNLFTTTNASTTGRHSFAGNNITIGSQIKFTGGATIDEASGGKVSLSDSTGIFAILDTGNLVTETTFVFPENGGGNSTFGILENAQTWLAGNIFTASSTFLSLNAVNSTTTNATTTSLAITGLATPAGAFLAVNPQGTVIATTTPSGGSGDITSVGDVASGAAFDGTQGTTLTFNNAGGDATIDYDGTDIQSSKLVTAPGFMASASTTLQNFTSSIGTTTSFTITSITNSILKANSLGQVTGISATNTISNILSGSNPIGVGAYMQELGVDGTNDLFRGTMWVASSTTAKIGHHGSFAVPTNCNDSIYSIMVPFTVAVGSGNVVIDLDYASIGGDDTESFDVSAWEESLTVTDAAPSASLRRLTQMFNLNSTNIAPGDTFEFALSRDGADGSDTAAGGLLFKDVKFECSM